MRQCFIYVRVSTEEQAKEGYSIEAQKKACIERAQKLGYQVVDIFADEGETATASQRPKFQEMLDRCEEVDAIIVWHTDRFARSETDHFSIKALLKQSKTQLISVTQPMLDDTPEGWLLDTVLAGVNAFYSRDLSRKTKKGLVQKWEEGWWPGWAPLGYMNVKNEDGKGIVIPDPNTAPIIKKLFRLYSTGNYSVLDLQKWLHEKGVSSKTDKRLQHSVVHGILNNPFYYGWMRWGGMEKKGNHKPLIGKQTFDLCQYIMTKHRSFLVYERKHQFLLSGFIFCGDCGLRYTAEWHRIKSQARNNRIGYYHCTKREGCNDPYVELGELEKQVEEQFKGLEFTEDFIQKVAAKAKRIYKESTDEIEEEKRLLLNRKKALEIKRDRLEDRLLDDTVDRETYKRKNSEFKSKLKSIDIQLAKLAKKREADISVIDETLAMSRNIYQTYKDAPPPLKRQHLRFFFEKIFVKDKKIADVKMSLILTVLKEEEKIASGYKSETLAPRSLRTSNILNQVVEEIRKYFIENTFAFNVVQINF